MRLTQRWRFALMLAFQDMLRQCKAGELEIWLEHARASSVAAFASFERGFYADVKAVRVALILD